MILQKLFPMDSDRIADIQRDVYGPSLWHIFNISKRHYRRAEAIIGINTELGEQLNIIDGFDHRTLQWFHDAIAGQFRLQYCLNTNLFDSLIENFGEKETIINLWHEFLFSEMRRLFQRHTELPREICTAVVYANPNPRGIDAEDFLYEITLSEYEDLKLHP